MFPNDQGLGYLPDLPYEQYIGPGGVSSADGTIVL